MKRLLANGIVLGLAARLAVADSNLEITGLKGGYLSWNNVNPDLYYSVQWKPSLTDTNGWRESFRVLQDVQSTNDPIQVPIPIFFQVVGRSNRIHTLQMNAASHHLAAGYYEATDLSAVDPDLDSGNILQGTTVFDVEGSLLPSGGTAAPEDVVAGKTFYGANQTNWALQIGTYGNVMPDSDVIYVSASNGTDLPGAGMNPGDPCQTITWGLMRTFETGRSQIHVADGVYTESIALNDGVDLLGGYDPDDWIRRVSPVSSTVIRSSSSKTVVLQNAAQPSEISGITLHGADAAAGTSSYAVYLRNNTGIITLTNNTIFAGHGGDGLRGSDRAAGAVGSAGQQGLDASEPFSTRSGGSGGASSCGTSGGDGGGSVPPAIYPNQSSAEDGDDGVGLSGGSGGDGGYDAKGVQPGNGPQEGSSGDDGGAGIPGTGGSGAINADGSVISGEWVAASGLAGAAGTAGSGGGGGGSGGGVEDNGSGSASGGTGGGGGAGGCAGAGGSAGEGGGGSFCVFVDGGAAPSIAGNVFHLGHGGDGGDGGAGGAGGIGGVGGTGGEGAKLASSKNFGGDGGAGGNGGAGGGGGGGGGGMACGILINNVSGADASVYQSGNTFSEGVPGGGGLGGYSVVSSGSNGINGTVEPVNVR